MTTADLHRAFIHISALMTENRDALVQIDQQMGDGDLGLSMAAGFSAVAAALAQNAPEDLGQFFRTVAATLNEAAPSTMGTLLSLLFMGMAKALRGRTEIDLAAFASALDAGLQSLMQKSGAKPGEKTLLDALTPAMQSLLDHADRPAPEAFALARDAARLGAEATRNMRSVHGRAAYFGDESLGKIDGGAVVGQHLMDGFSRAFA